MPGGVGGAMWVAIRQDFNSLTEGEEWWEKQPLLSGGGEKNPDYVISDAWHPMP